MGDSLYLTLDIASNYLPQEVVDRAEFQTLLNQSEFDTIMQYRRGPVWEENTVEAETEYDEDGEEIDPVTSLATVKLRYYQEDPNDLDDSDFNQRLFLEAMRREIANTVIHRATQDTMMLPEDFGRRLRVFELVPVFNLVG